MWQVLRRQQGEYYEKEGHVAVPSDLAGHGEHVKVALSLRTISMHETKPYAPPKDPLVLTMPYGNVVYPKIARNLGNENVVLRRQAVQMLLDLYLLKREHIVMSLGAGILDALLERLNDADDDMRTQACIALEFIVKEPKGQEVVLSRGTEVLSTFLNATDDQCGDVVVEALRLLSSTHAAYNEYESTRRLVALGAIPRYIKKVLDRDDAVCCTACGALVKVLEIKEAFVEVIQHSGMEAVTKALRRNDEPMILVEASGVVSNIAVFGQGLARCTSLQTVAALIPHLRHEHVTVRTHCTSAAAQLVVHAEGKAQAIACGIVPALSMAVSVEDELDVLMNLVKTIRLVSEHPQARAELATVVDRLREIVSLAGEEHKDLAAATQKALASIEWVPGTPLP
jgi:hypothetical protein